MQVKKAIENAEKSSISITHRLNAYVSQAKQYRSSEASNKTLPDWKRTTLTALIPLAAVSAAQAQCKGGLTPIILGPNQNFNIDVDADGVNDIRIHGGPLSSFGYGLQYWAVAPINPSFYIGITSVGKARGAQDGFVVTRGQPFVGNQRDMCRSFGFGQFCLSYTTRSICVRKGDAVTGQPGWVRLSVGGLFGVGGVQFTVTERGIEAPSNVPINTAVVNNCASLAASQPVELISFNAEPQGKGINLTWATGSEINNSGFEVQRGTDGQHFSKIGWLPGLGTSTKGKEYGFLDVEVQSNITYYYRLRQLDHNGSDNFAPVRVAMVKEAGRLTVSQLFPNPASQGQGSAYFKVNSPAADEIDIQVFDARGGLVHQQAQAILEGENAITIPIGDRAAGVYFVKMQLKFEVNYQRLAVEN